MGFWKSARGINGDSWADAMGDLMKKLSTDIIENSTTYPEGNHEITMVEFADLIEFCSRGHIRAEIDIGWNADRPLSQLHDKDVETYPNRGQIHCAELIGASV